ncbi:hypothetical protein [Nakamurella multipartita]|jgi:hypothetical protein|uniref:Uncharacterized protein n=1 Tax=Nakamurella multipartita (strain ATCC 700099 / DSM 44233 / CIP 104796 / JCM 9543 / NBRC 105858 / Y-104) TaxID=479431 RepID=C8XA68_NAKMY|nr:hypothetical protein [Nakamurella multipartita]ACV81268.1 hypothetical protein Namu_4995 [Nakamurella multipartita DSM 44233]HOZ58955.1 hypothetical protein [Nakamurella multipartita]
MSGQESPERRARQLRRAWILAHHPDRGGDLDTFQAGLAELSGRPVPPPAAARPRVVRSRNPVRRLRRFVRRLRRRQPHRTLL